MGKQAAAGTQLMSAVAPAAVAAPSSMHEEEAIASMEMEQQRAGWMRGTTALAWRQWAGIKSKARAAGGYAVLRTRQGITMFGEPKIGPLVKDTRAHKQSQ